jgi:hypothetical protein
MKKPYRVINARLVVAVGTRLDPAGGVEVKEAERMFKSPAWTGFAVMPLSAWERAHVRIGRTCALLLTAASALWHHSRNRAISRKAGVGEPGIAQRRPGGAPGWRVMSLLPVRAPGGP